MASPPPVSVGVRPSRRMVWSVAAAMLGVHGALAWILRVPAVMTGNDDAVYLLLARSLRHLSYTDVFLAGAPVHAQYPPLYPALLALLGSVFGESLDGFLVANVALSMIGLGVVFATLERRSAGLALTTLAVLAVNPGLITMAGGIRSEPLFMAIAAVTLGSVARPVGRRVWLVATVGAIAAALTRTIGLTVIVAVLGVWLLERRWRPAAGLAVAAVLTVGPWMWWTTVAPGQFVGRSYIADMQYRPTPAPSRVEAPPRPDSSGPLRVDSLRGAIDPTVRIEPARKGWGIAALGQRIVGNLRRYASRTLPVALALPGRGGVVADNILWLVVFVAAGGVGAIGMARWWPAAVALLLVYGGLLAVWPYTVARYLVPILPWIVALLLTGSMAIGSRLGGRGTRRWLALVPLGGLAVAMLAGSLSGIVTELGAQSRCDRAAPLESAGCSDEPSRAFFVAARAIPGLLPDSTVVLTAKEGTFYYYTGRRTVTIAELANDPGIDPGRYLRAKGIDAVFFTHLKHDEGAVAERLRPVCDRLAPVAVWAPTTFLLAVRGPDPVSGENGCAVIDRFAALPWGVRIP